MVRSLSALFFEIESLAAARRLSVARRFNAGNEVNSSLVAAATIEWRRQETATIAIGRSTVAAATSGAFLKSSTLFFETRC